MKPRQVRGDPAGSEVIVLAQVEDLADDFTGGGAWRPLRYPLSIAEAGVPVLGVTSLPLVERFPRNPEPATDPGDVSLVSRLP
jgi:hypothetical protein